MALPHGDTTIPGPILIVAEYLSDKDEQGPLTSPIGKMFRAWMRQAGLDPTQCHFTTVLRGPTLNEALTKNKLEAVKHLRPVSTGRYLHSSHWPNVERLREFIGKLQPNVIVALGDLSLWATSPERSLKNSRGRVVESLDLFGAAKVIPTYSPMQVMADYALRPIVLADLGKALRESRFAGIRRPQRFIHIEPSLDDMQDFYERYIVPAPDVSVDIETKGDMITCVGFAPSKERCLVVPFFDELKPKGNYWETKTEELAAWRFVTMVLRRHSSFGQNFQYDMQYLWAKMGIPARKFCDDTMLLHHALQPEMQKGLGFLASIYTDELPWKFMHKVRSDDRTGKKEDV